MKLRRSERAPLTGLELFVRAVIAGSALGLVGGGVWGFVRGLDYPRTVPVAVFEGAVLVGVPAAVALAVIAGIVTSTVLGIARLRRGPGPARGQNG